jgi:hypothetical protein
MPVSAVPQFIAGLIYEFVGDNNLEAIEGCYTGGKEIEA